MNTLIILSLIWSQQLDILVSDSWSPNAVFFDDNGHFVDSGQSLGDSISWAIGVGDLTADGSLDFAVANDGACYVYHNDGFGNFTRQSPFGSNLPVGSSMCLADMDQDGTLDLVLGTKTGQFTSDNQIFLNDGSGDFTAPDSLFGAGNTRSLAVADLDGDTYPDIFDAQQSSANRVFLNDQSGGVTDSGQSLGSGSSFSVALGDLDGNGTIDAVVANDGQANTVWLNDGNAEFTLGASLGSNENSLAVALGDLNGDGHLDIVFGNDGAIYQDPTMVYFNDGSGNFTLSSQSFPSPRTLSLHIVDINRDGKLDILAGNAGADNIWINQGTGQFTLRTDTLNLGYSTSVFGGFLRTDYQSMVSDWSSPWTILDLMAFEKQLKATNEPFRGR